MNRQAETDELAELEPLLGELVAVRAGEHTEPGDLLAYHDGRLSAEEETLVQAHLAICPACSAALLDLDAFGAAATARAGQAPAELATSMAWRAFAPRLAETRREPPRRQGTPLWMRALAASLLLAVPALALLLARSQRQVDELRGSLATPQAEVPMLYLDAVTRDEGLATSTLELPPGDGFFLLAVTPALEAPAERYRVEILDEAGGVVWRDDSVPPSDHGTLRLGFTRRSLPPGRYRVEIRAGGPTDPPAVFSFVLRDPA